MPQRVSQDDDPLYPRALLRLAADAHGAGHLAKADADAVARNPACGDSIKVELALAGDGTIRAFAHDTHACVITQASASLLAQNAIGLDRAGIAALASRIGAMLSGAGSESDGYEIFQTLVPYAGRHRCVLLPIEAAITALESSKPGGKAGE